MNKTKKIAISLIASSILVNNIYAKDITSLNTVTVTAQKQEQNLQEVPMSITVFDEQSLNDKNIDSMSDIATYIPNFTTFQVNGLNVLANPSIRGISSSLHASMVSVPTIIDGVPITSSHGYDLSLLDIESIEVLRGPQGTLYGAGAEAGAIVITTKKPDNETRGKIGLEIGSDNKKQYSFSASGAVVEDKLYIGLAGKHYEKDGYIKNTITNKLVNDKENNYGKINLRYTPTDNLDISFISSKYETNDGARNSNLVYQPKTVTSNLEGYSKYDSLLNSLKINYDFKNYKFESITTQSNNTLNFMDDFDYSQNTTLHSGFPSIDMDKISQEFRLSGEKNNLNWLVGVYGDSEKHYYNKITDTSSKHVETEQDLTMKSLGIFAHSIYTITPKLSLSTGIRFDKVEKTIKEDAKNIDLESKYNEVSPKISLNYMLNKDIMTFATIAKGYNPGAFNHHNTDAEEISFGSEKLVSYEMGVKSSLLDNKITLNGAIYYIDIGNLHTVNYTTATTFVRSNKAKATSKGFELEVQAQVNDTISIFANYGYSDVTFDEYNDTKGDYKGNSKSYAPKYNYSVGVQYRDENGYFARTDLTGYGDMYLDDANKYKRDGYNLVNAKIGYETEEYDIYLYGKNIFDKEYNSDGFGNGRFTIYSEPREIGLQLAYRF